MRRLAGWLIGLFAAALLLASIAVVFREAVVARAAEAYLAARGFPEASISVGDIGFRGATLVDLALGPGLPTVERLEARYRIIEVLGLRLRGVRIHGLRARVDFRELETIRRLAGLLPGGAGGGSFVPGPDIGVSDARIELANTGIGDVVLAAGGSLDLTQPRARAMFDARSLGLPKGVLKALERAELRVTAMGPSDQESAAPHALARISARLGDDEGELTLGADVAWARGERFDGATKVGVNLEIRGASLADHRLASLSWRSEGTVTGRSANIAGPLKAEAPVLRSGGLTVKDVGLEGEVGLSAGPRIRFAASMARGRVRIAAPPVLGPVRIKGPVDLAIPSVRVDYAPDRGLVLNARIVPDAVDAVVVREAGDDIELTARAKAVEASLQVADGIGGRLLLSDGAVRIAGKGLAGENIQATIPFPFRLAGRPIVLSGRVKSTSDPVLFAPLAIDIRATPEVDAFSLSGAVELPGLGVRLPLRGRFAHPERRGRIDFGPAALEFRPGALQPRMLGAALDAVKQAAGAVTLAGALDFKPDTPLDGEIAVDIDALTLAMAGFRIEGLAGKLRLDRLFPPRTPGVQALSARRAVLGLPLDKPTMRFRLEPKEARSTVLIERAEGRLAGGLVYLDKERFDPSAERNRFVIAVRRLSLERLLRDWAMEGLSGTGTISGTIPVVLMSKGAGIEPSTLEAEGVGVLRVNWGSARGALLRQGDEVALMVRALEDFRYSSLRITVARPLEGSLSLKVAMEGRNPAVRAGHPFRFNISFSGNLENILAAVAEGRRLGADLLQGGIGATQ